MLLKYHHHEINLQLVFIPWARPNFASGYHPLKLACVNHNVSFHHNLGKNISREVWETWYPTMIDSSSLIFRGHPWKTFKFVWQSYMMYYILETRNKTADSFWNVMEKRYPKSVLNKKLWILEIAFTFKPLTAASWCEMVAYPSPQSYKCTPVRKKKTRQWEPVMGKGNAGKAEGRKDHVTFSSLMGQTWTEALCPVCTRRNLGKNSGKNWEESLRNTTRSWFI